MNGEEIFIARVDFVKVETEFGFKLMGLLKKRKDANKWESGQWAKYFTTGVLDNISLEEFIAELRKLADILELKKGG